MVLSVRDCNCFTDWYLISSFITVDEAFFIFSAIKIKNLSYVSAESLLNSIFLAVYRPRYEAFP